MASGFGVPAFVGVPVFVIVRVLGLAQVPRENAAGE
jgi:hypothetical protein